MLRWVGGGHKAREEGPESWKHLWAPEGSQKCLGKAIPCRKPLPKLRTLYAGSKPSSLSHSPPRTQSPPTQVENRDTHPYKTPKHKCPLHKAPPPPHRPAQQDGSCCFLRPLRLFLAISSFLGLLHPRQVFWIPSRSLQILLTFEGIWVSQPPALLTWLMGPRGSITLLTH